MPGMAKKRRHGDEPPRPAPNRSGVPIHAYVDPAIVAQLDVYLDGTRPKVSKTAAIEDALIAFLEGKGHWPPPEGSK